MFILIHENDISQLPDTTPPEVISKIAEILKGLDENYGSGRKLLDDGGFVAYTTDRQEAMVALPKQTGLKIGISTPEFVEVIETATESYLNVLNLTNNEYAITAILPKSIAPKSLLNDF